jgi:hypothetical protein
MKGLGEGGKVGAEYGMKMNMQQQLMDAQMEKDLRVDEIKRGRDVVEEERKLSPEYLAKVNAADLEKGRGAIENRTTLAPLSAAAATAEYNAGKPLEDIKTTDAIKRKIEETTTLSKDKDFLAGETALSEAKGAAGIKAAKIRADSIKDRAGSGGGSSAVKVRSTYTDDQGQKIAVLSNGDTKVLGKAADYDKTLSNLVTKMAKDDYKFAKLPEAEKRKQAEERLRGSIPVQSSGRDLSRLSAYERDATAD